MTSTSPPDRATKPKSTPKPKQKGEETPTQPADLRVAVAILTPLGLAITANFWGVIGIVCVLATTSAVAAVGYLIKEL